MVLRTQAKLWWYLARSKLYIPQIQSTLPSWKYTCRTVCIDSKMEFSTRSPTASCDILDSRWTVISLRKITGKPQNHGQLGLLSHKLLRKLIQGMAWRQILTKCLPPTGCLGPVQAAGCTSICIPVGYVKFVAAVGWKPPKQPLKVGHVALPFSWSCSCLKYPVTVSVLGCCSHGPCYLEVCSYLFLMFHSTALLSKDSSDIQNLCHFVLIGFSGATVDGFSVHFNLMTLRGDLRT